jgi:GntR family transcriptional regulator/MocR family aminotransferase
VNRPTAGAPNETSDARDVLVEIEFRRGSMRRNLRNALRAAIQDGRLVAGTVLPASRRLAAELEVSRGVVTDAYDQLSAEGYLEMQARRAPVVSNVAMVPQTVVEAAAPSWRFDFVATTPDVRAFPRRAWLRAMERALRTAPDEAFNYGDHRGRIELRAALSAYLGRVRSVRVDPSRIVITQGFSQALDLVCRLLVARGALSIGIESPSLPDEWAAARGVGLQVEGCVIDAEGVRVDQLANLSAAAIVVTPAHQFPSGVVMAPARRTALLAWATANGRLIVEDDYDAEFRYDRSPVGAIQGLDPRVVIHVGTASKTLAPGIRLGWMSVPADLIEEVTALKALVDSGSPTADQLAMAELITSGDYDRHVARARHVYRRLRDRLVTALASYMPRHPHLGAAAGLHVLLLLPDGTDDVDVAARAAVRGIGVRALSPMFVDGPGRPGLLLGYGRLDEARIEAAVATLARVLRDAGIPGSSAPPQVRAGG